MTYEILKELALYRTEWLMTTVILVRLGRGYSHASLCNSLRRLHSYGQVSRRRQPALPDLEWRITQAGLKRLEHHLKGGG